MPEQPSKNPATRKIVPRRWPRFAVDLSLRVRITTSAGPEYVLAHGRDVSPVGMAVYVPVDLEVGGIAHLELSFPGVDNPVILQARVRNREGFKYGVEFIDATPEQQNIILTNLHGLVRSTKEKSSTS